MSGARRKDVPEVREAGADVVDRELRATFAQTVQAPSRQRVVVVDLGVLGDLDHDCCSAMPSKSSQKRESRSGRR